MIRSTEYILILLVVMLSFGSANAQTASEPVYLLHNNAVWQWSESGGLFPIGEPIKNLIGISLSPRGDKFLVATYRDEVKALVDAECPCGGPVPDGREYWLLDAATGQRTLITGQPDVIEDTSVVVYYGNASWSPDGGKVAWTQDLDYSDLEVYDVQTGQITLLAADMPPQALASNVTDLTAWTPTGIWVERVNYDDDLYGTPGGYAVYGLSGNMVEVPPYHLLARSPDLADLKPYPKYTESNHYVVDDGGEDVLVTHSPAGWQTYNLRTGESQPLTGGRIVEVALNAPQSLRLYPAVMAEDGSITREVHAPDGSWVATPRNPPDLFTLSGRGIVTDIEGTQITIMRSAADGGALIVDLPWTPARVIDNSLAYVLERGGDQVELGVRCEESALPIRFPFTFGDESQPPVGYVSDDLPNNLRSTPSHDGALVGTIPAGGSFEVLEGPTCSRGIAWWRVENADTVRGWTAEGEGNEYWIAPGCSVPDCDSEG